MKNIHILPTDKPSRLLFDKEENRLLPLQEVDCWMEHQDLVENQNIYITSNEEIKDVRPHKGKWQLEKGEILNKFPNYLTDLSECKLVIITTDPDLIKDGVQSINDEFLEWFIKNPSCEEVEIDKGYRGIGLFNYKIIIPKEENSIEAKQRAKNYMRLKGALEPKQEKTFEDVLDESLAKTKVILEELRTMNTKQETLEEVAERLFPFTKDDSENRIITIKRLFWIEGAKWQQERMYSEEEVRKILWEYIKPQSTSEGILLDGFLEQFKKK